MYCGLQKIEDGINPYSIKEHRCKHKSSNKIFDMAISHYCDTGIPWRITFRTKCPDCRRMRPEVLLKDNLI